MKRNGNMPRAPEQRLSFPLATQSARRLSITTAIIHTRMHRKGLIAGRLFRWEVWAWPMRGEYSICTAMCLSGVGIYIKPWLRAGSLGAAVGSASPSSAIRRIAASSRPAPTAATSVSDSPGRPGNTREFLTALEQECHLGVVSANAPNVYSARSLSLSHIHLSSSGYQRLKQPTQVKAQYHHHRNRGWTLSPVS